VWLYFRFCLSYWDIEEMMDQRGHSCKNLRFRA